MRLIDADALIKTLGIGDLPIRLTCEIYNAPTVDSVPVIRCKDCKWNKSDKWVDCPITEMYGRTTDNYCSLAERREKC